MGVILTQHQVSVKQGMDLVQAKFSDRSMLLYYQDTFEICSKMRGLGTFALRYERNSPKLMIELEKYEQEPPNVPLSPRFRRSGLKTNVKAYRVDYEDQLVVLEFRDFTNNIHVVKMHYTDAVIVRAWLFKAAKEAKAWAGDDSRGFRVFAKLTDAEDNDKFAFG